MKLMIIALILFSPIFYVKADEIFFEKTMLKEGQFICHIKDSYEVEKNNMTRKQNKFLENIVTHGVLKLRFDKNGEDITENGHLIYPNNYMLILMGTESTSWFGGGVAYSVVDVSDQRIYATNMNDVVILHAHTGDLKYIKNEFHLRKHKGDPDRSFLERVIRANCERF